MELTSEIVEQISQKVIKEKQSYMLKNDYFCQLIKEVELKEKTKLIKKKQAVKIKVLGFNFSFADNSIMVLINENGNKYYTNLKNLKYDTH
jgi:ethanolamine utilization protein EutQ (cupin superfamily)